MNYMEESGRRLRAAIGERTFREISELTSGVLSKTRIENYAAGRRMIGPEEAVLLGKALKTSPSYLLCLEDEDHMTPQELKLIHDFRALDEKDRNAFARRLDLEAQLHREAYPDSRLHLPPPPSMGRPKKAKR